MKILEDISKHFYNFEIGKKLLKELLKQDRIPRPEKKSIDESA